MKKLNETEAARTADAVTEEKAAEKTEAAVSKADDENDSETAARKDRRLDTVARIATLILAVIIWLYVRVSTDVTIQQSFDVIPVDVQGITAMQEKGLAIYAMSFSHVNVTLKGSRNALSGVTRANINAYVDLSEVSEPGEYELTVKYQIPSGVALVTQSEKLVVTVDKTESRLFTIGAANVFAEKFSIADSCRMDLASAKSNVSFIKVDAPTLILSQIEGVRLVANSTVTLTSSSDISATVEFIDRDGNPVIDEAIRYTAYAGGTVTSNGSVSGGVVRSQITVNIPLIKEKEIPVRYTDKEGIITDENITLSPSTVIIKGAPDAVDAVDFWEIGSFSAKNLIQENGHTVVYLSVSPQSFPDGVTEVSYKDGTSYVDTAPVFGAEIKVGGTYTLTVPKSDITVVGTNSEKVELVDENLMITLRTAGDETYFLLLENSVNAGKGGISLVVNMTDVAWSLDGQPTVAPVTVIFSSEFEGRVYEIFDEDQPYQVTVKFIG